MRKSIYVNFDIGSDASSCGSKTQPCKHLQLAVDKSTYEVVIIGTIPLVRTVNVVRNLTIRSDESQDNATVNGEGMSRSTAFTLPDDIEVNLNITGINFVDAGVVKMGSRSNVYIHLSLIHI